MTDDVVLRGDALRKDRLARNANLYQYDPNMERLLKQMSDDPEAWKRLPRDAVSQASTYYELKQNYLDAVNAGAIIPDDRGGPSAA